MYITAKLFVILWLYVNQWPAVLRKCTRFLHILTLLTPLTAALFLRFEDHGDGDALLHRVPEDGAAPVRGVRPLPAAPAPRRRQAGLLRVGNCLCIAGYLSQAHYKFFLQFLNEL